MFLMVLYGRLAGKNSQKNSQHKMKKILILILVIISFKAHSQTDNYVLKVGAGTTYNLQTYSPVIQQVTTGTSATLADSTTMFVINPASVIASYTATLPATPFNGKVVTFSFGGTITATATTVITNLTIVANTGHTIVGTGAIGTVTTDDHITCVFYNSKWYQQ